MNRWLAFHRVSAIVRWPTKVALFLLVVALVLYPKVWLVPVWVGRLTDMGSVLDPRHEGLAPLEREARAALDQQTAGQQVDKDKAVLSVVQEVVCKHVPYAWDWDTWGVFDYLPTVAEVFAKGREDCDGRAVVAASLLQRMGYDAWLVCDLKHVWVRTPDGDTMGPGDGEATLSAPSPDGVTPPRTKLRVNLATLANIGRGLTFGIGVFPLVRLLIIWLALCAVAIHPWQSNTRRVIGSALLLAAIAFFHAAAPTARGLGEHPVMAWMAWGAAVIGCGLLMFKAGARRTSAIQPESPATDAAGPD